jgi:radical SAM protein with 4Fe4S-binding SPASM domain
MRYFLSADCALKHLETPSVYHIKKDELYEVDNEGFSLLTKCLGEEGLEADKDDFISYCLEEGILTGENVKCERPPLIKSPAPSLRYLELQITKRCNLRCRHCYIGPAEDIELPALDVKRILNEFERMQGLRLLITGGEPLLHREFHKINELIPGYAFRKILFTNGTLMDGETLKRLNVEEIQVSVDGLEAAHDSLRGGGSFRKAMGAVKAALDSGFEVSVSTMIHAMNLNDFDEMEEIFRKTGIKDWNVDVPCTAGNLRENPAFILPPDVAGRYLRHGFGGGIHESKTGFACGAHLMSVTARGKCSKCSFYADKPIGSIKEGLKTCWGRLKPIRLNELRCDCDVIDVCRGGCRYRASLLSSESGKDLYRCALYDKI